MPTNIDISRPQGSTAQLLFNIVDASGNPIDVSGWTGFELSTYIEPALEFDRTVTFTDSDTGGAFSEDARVIVGDSSGVNGFIDAGEILRITKGKPTIYIHDGVAIPMTDPIDTDGHIWKQFNLDNLATGESLAGTPAVLINNVAVSVSDEQDGMTFHEIQTDGISRVKLRLQGAQEGQEYTLTIRYATNYTPSNDRSQKFYGRSL